MSGSILYNYFLSLTITSTLQNRVGISPKETEAREVICLSQQIWRVSPDSNLNLTPKSIYVLFNMSLPLPEKAVYMSQTDSTDLY